MIPLYRLLLSTVLPLALLMSLPATASRLATATSDERILVAAPAPDLVAYLVAHGFAIESRERLRALDLLLVIAAPPRRLPAAAALRDLRVRFPDAVVALDDPFDLAHDARAGRPGAVQPRQIMTAIGWPADGYIVRPGLRVGVIDSSLDGSHPALQEAAIVQRRFTSGKDPASDTAHGTAIAAMLVGRSDDSSIAGLIGGATLFYAGIFQDGQHGAFASSADFLRAIDWMIESGVTVINASVTSRSENAVVVYAMSLLAREQVILVAAAGNDGPSGSPVYPAAIPSAFAVTAVSIEGDAYGEANTGDYIDIAAPGINLPTTSRKITSGTSLAVPFVTAAVAHVIDVCGIAPGEAEARLEARARDLGPSGRDSAFGWGLLQALPGCRNADPGMAAQRIFSLDRAAPLGRDSSDG